MGVSEIEEKVDAAMVTETPEVSSAWFLDGIPLDKSLLPPPCPGGDDGGGGSGGDATALPPEAGVVMVRHLVGPRGAWYTHTWKWTMDRNVLHNLKFRNCVECFVIKSLVSSF